MTIIAAATPTIPRPADDSPCPSWCTRDACAWEQDVDGSQYRLHEHTIGLFTVTQIEDHTPAGSAFRPPSGDTSLESFDTSQDARDLAVDLVRIALLMERIEAGTR